jgi:Ser/Thr protein kinase RdoA (MazF antagonist)
MTTPPDHVVAAYGWADADAGAEIAPMSGGLINTTFVVRRNHAPIAVLQRVHPVFGPDVNLDIDAVTTHLAARGLTTPRLLRTALGAAFVLDGKHHWRALSWIDGVSVHAVPAPTFARAGGELVGHFHRAVSDLSYAYRFTRGGVHDTAAHLARLADRLAHASDLGAPAEAVDLGREILDTARALPPMPPALPRRHTHGDLKISNLLFRRGDPPGDPHAIALVDLDTLGLQTLAFELGDAMRSWCNPHGEDVGAITFDLDIFAAAIGGWRSVAGDLFDEAERASIVVGLETVCVELAARFTVDVFDDSYFGWDASRFPSRRAHNLLRARSQLALGRAVRAARSDANDIVIGK